MEKTEYMFMYTKCTILCHDMYIVDKDLKDPTKIKKAWLLGLLILFLLKKVIVCYLLITKN